MKKILLCPRSHFLSLLPAASAQWTWAKPAQEAHQGLIPPLCGTTALTIILLVSLRWIKHTTDIQEELDCRVCVCLGFASWCQQKGREGKLEYSAGCRADTTSLLTGAALINNFNTIGSSIVYSCIYIKTNPGCLSEFFWVKEGNYARNHNVSLIFLKMLWRGSEALWDVRGLNMKRKDGALFFFSFFPPLRSKRGQELSSSLSLKILSIWGNLCKSATEIFKGKHLFWRVIIAQSWKKLQRSYLSLFVEKEVFFFPLCRLRYIWCFNTSENMFIKSREIKNEWTKLP